MQAVAVLLLITFVVLVVMVPTATGGFKAGIAGVAYRNTGTYGSPTWTAAPIVADVQFALPWDFGDGSSRVTRAKLYGKTQVDASVSPTAVLDMLILDGPVTKEGARGVRAHFLFSLAGQPQGRGDGVYTTFDLKFGVSSEGVPSAVIVGASSALTAVAF